MYGIAIRKYYLEGIHVKNLLYTVFSRLINKSVARNLLNTFVG